MARLMSYSAAHNTFVVFIWEGGLASWLLAKFVLYELFQKRLSEKYAKCTQS